MGASEVAMQCPRVLKGDVDPLQVIGAVIGKGLVAEWMFRRRQKRLLALGSSGSGEKSPEVRS